MESYFSAPPNFIIPSRKLWRDPAHALNTDAYLHNQLVCTGHQCEAVGVVESLRDVLAKSVSGTSRGDAPAAAVVRVRPQQVTHGTLWGK